MGLEILKRAEIKPYYKLVVDFSLSREIFYSRFGDKTFKQKYEFTSEQECLKFIKYLYVCYYSGKVYHSKEFQKMPPHKRELYVISRRCYYVDKNNAKHEINIVLDTKDVDNIVADIKLYGMETTFWTSRKFCSKDPDIFSDTMEKNYGYL